MDELDAMLAHMDAETATLDDVSSQMSALARELMLFREELAAPIECMRDQRGRLVAVRRGQRVIPIARNDDAARMIQ